MKSDVWSLGITMVMLRDGACSPGVGMGSVWCSDPAVSSGSWWLHPWVAAQQTGLDSGCESSRLEINYPERQGGGAVLCTQGHLTPGQVTVSLDVQPVLLPLLRLLPSWLTGLPGDLLPLLFSPFLHVPAGSWEIHTGFLCIMT